MRRLKAVRYFQNAVIIGVILISTGLPALAKRIYTVGAQINSVASLDSNPLDSNPQVNNLGFFGSQSGDLSNGYGLYPSVFLNSTGLQSNLQLSYAFGLNQNNSNLDLGSESHSFSGALDTALTRNLTLTISESFTRSSNFTTFNILSGIALTPQGLVFDFNTIALRQNSYANSTSLALNYTLSPRSSLSFGVGHSIRNFEENPFFQNSLSDQTGFNGNIAYSRELNQRTGLNLTYSVSQNNFREFEEARTQNATVGLSRQVSPSVSIDLSGGPSYVRSQETNSDFLGYNASFHVEKAFEENLISLAYNHQTGTSTGLGSVSDTDTLALNFSRPLGRKTNISANLSLYQTSARLDNPVELRGGTASILLGFLLSRNLTLNVTGTYQRQQGEDLFDVQRSAAASILLGFLLSRNLTLNVTGTYQRQQGKDLFQGREIFDVERKRVFISLSYILPELLRFEK